MNIGALPAEMRFMMSMPRLAWTENMFSLVNGAKKLGLQGDNYQGVFWEQGMENMLEKAIEGGYKYMLAIDYDTVYLPGHIVDLYNIMEANPDLDIVFPLQPRRGNPYPMAADFEDFEKNQGDLVKITKGNFKECIVPCDTGHFGLSVIRLDALNRLSKPWFNSTPAKNGGWGRGHKDADVAFWIKCKKEGVKVALAEVWIGHLEVVCSWCGPKKDHFKTVHMYTHEALQGVPEWAQPKCMKEKGVSND